MGANINHAGCTCSVDQQEGQDVMPEELMTPLVALVWTAVAFLGMGVVAGLVALFIMWRDR